MRVPEVQKKIREAQVWSGTLWRGGRIAGEFDGACAPLYMLGLLIALAGLGPDAC